MIKKIKIYFRSLEKSANHPKKDTSYFYNKFQNVYIDILLKSKILQGNQSNGK
jgi:hypothetical protein